MQLFYLKYALNQPKMFNTWILLQSSLSVSTFRKNGQRFIAVKNLATATHFPLKSLEFTLKKGGISINKVATTQNIKKSWKLVFRDTFKGDSCQILDLYDEFMGGRGKWVESQHLSVNGWFTVYWPCLEFCIWLFISAETLKFWNKV